MIVVTLVHPLQNAMEMAKIVRQVTNLVLLHVIKLFEVRVSYVVDV